MSRNYSPGARSGRRSWGPGRGRHGGVPTSPAGPAAPPCPLCAACPGSGNQPFGAVTPSAHCPGRAAPSSSEQRLPWWCLRPTDDHVWRGPPVPPAALHLRCRRSQPASALTEAGCSPCSRWWLSCGPAARNPTRTVPEGVHSREIRSAPSRPSERSTDGIRGAGKLITVRPAVVCGRWPRLHCACVLS